MKIADLLEKNNKKMSSDLADILVKSIKEIFPFYYDSCSQKGMSNFAIANFISNIDLTEEDISSIVSISSRYSKLWSFS